MKRRSIVVHISKEHKEMLSDVKRKSGLTVKHSTEKAIEDYMRKNYPEIFNKFKEKKDEGKN